MLKIHYTFNTPSMIIMSNPNISKITDGKSLCLDKMKTYIAYVIADNDNKVIMTRMETGDKDNCHNCIEIKIVPLKNVSDS